MRKKAIDQGLVQPRLRLVADGTRGWGFAQTARWPSGNRSMAIAA
jgi:hypothetical protein